MRWLWLSGESPDAPDTGLLAYTRGLSDACAAPGLEIVGLGLDRGIVPDASPVAWRRVTGHRRPASRSLVHPLPAMAYGFATPAFRRAVANALTERWDAVVIDHLQMGWVHQMLETAHRPAVVHVAHNHETSVRSDVARAAPFPRRIPLGIDARKVARLEATVIAASNVAVTLTESDAARFRTTSPRCTPLVLPPGHPRAEHATVRPGSSTSRTAVIVGSFDWHVKEDNLRTFLDVADPLFASHDAAIRVVGRLSPALAEEASTRRATTFAGRVDDIAAELERARVGIIAEPTGGGFKMKALDYVFNGVPVAMLSGSADGLPLEDGRSVLTFPTIETLAAGVLAALDDDARLKAIATEALAACAGRFDWAARGQSLRDAVDAAIRAGG